MFSIRIPLQNDAVTVKFSQAKQAASLNSQTKGLAFKYVAQGQEQYELGKQQLTLGAGEFILLPQKCAFTARAQPHNQVVQGICIDFFSDVDELTADLMTSKLLLGLPLPVSFLDSVDKVPQKAGSLTSLSGELWVQELKQATIQLSAKAGRIQPILSDLARKTSTQQQLFLHLELARRYIKKHYRQQIRLATLAKRVGLSPHRLQRFFRAVYGQSPQQMIIQERMVSAKKLLTQPELSLQEIAFWLGYSDQAAFSNQFLRTYNQRPSEMRRWLLNPSA